MSKANMVVAAEEMAAIIDNLAQQVLERHGAGKDLAIIGIQRRGVDLALRLKNILDERLGQNIPLGKLDINLYRDDWSDLTVQPIINCTEIPFDITKHKIILVDDVLFTGRTVRAALEAILDYGRPRRVELMCLVDRGHRELPIQPDYVGMKIETDLGDHVNVLIRERDDADKICLTRLVQAGC